MVLWVEGGMNEPQRGLAVFADADLTVANCDAPPPITALFNNSDVLAAVVNTEPSGHRDCFFFPADCRACSFHASSISTHFGSARLLNLRASFTRACAVSASTGNFEYISSFIGQRSMKGCPSLTASSMLALALRRLRREALGIRRRPGWRSGAARTDPRTRRSRPNRSGASRP